MKSTALSLALPAIVLTAAADEPAAGAQPVRTIFERHDQSGVPGKEIVIGSAMLPAGTTVGYHTHPGDESGYVLKGVLILHTRGQPDKILHAATVSSTSEVRCTVYPRCQARRAGRRSRLGLSTRDNRWQRSPRDPNVDCDEIPLVDVGRVGRATSRMYWYRTSCRPLI
jgi:hypothetical protein